jgi:dehydrogenase/reductase SDR family member 7B
MKNKVVIITGASSGIGKALSFEFARLGAKLVLASRSGVVAPELFDITSDILDLRANVAIESDCEFIIKKALERFGRIDILINNAGISMRALFSEVNLDVLRQLMDTNFWGTVYCTKFALPFLLESGGSLVGVSSIAGYKGLPGRTGYSASKFAMQGFLEVVRIENQNKGLHVLIACPGFTASNIRNVALSKDGTSQGETPLDEARLMTAEVVASHIVHAIERKKDRLILTTQGKLTVLLNKFFPKFIDRMVYKHMAKEPDSPLK